MSGVSHRGPTAGFDGVGKVHFRFKPKPPPRGHRKLAVIVYGLLFSCIAISFSWRRPFLKDGYVVPFLRNFVSFGDQLKLMLSNGKPARSGHVTDTDGYVHLTAVNMSEVLRLQGYQHASDKLMQMEISRRTVFGTLSEFYGNSTVESDKLYRTLNFVDLAREDYQNMENVDKALLDAYAAGVNAYLQECSTSQSGGSLPIDFDLLFGLSSRSFSILPWEAYHTLALLRLVTYEWGHGWEDSVKEKVFAAVTHMDAESLWFTKEKTTIGKHTQVPSLNGVVVAVSGARSASHKPLLANSLNTLAQHSGLWYFNSLHVPDQLDVSGASIPGIPFVWVGTNHAASWGITPAAHSATEDIIITHHSTTSEETITVREEVIKVRGQKEALVHFARRTAAGPIISDHFSSVLAGAVQTHLPNWRHVALKTAALRSHLAIAFLLQLNQARNEEQLREAAQEAKLLNINTVYAVKQSGAIGMVTSDDSDYEQGALSTPDIIVSSGNSDHSDRICELIRCDSNEKVAIAALQRVLTDAYSPTSILLRDYLLQLEMTVPMNEAQQVEVSSARALIRPFDGVYSTDAAAPVLLEAFRVVLLSNLLRPLGSLAGLASSNGAGIGGGSALVGRRMSGVSIRTEIQWVLDTLLAPKPVVAEAPTCSAKDSSPRGTCNAPVTVDSSVEPTGATTITTSAVATDSADGTDCAEADGVSAPLAPPAGANAANTTWWTARLLPRSPSVLAQESFLEAIEWCVATFGRDMGQWKWGTAHRVQYSHSNPKFIELLDELLSLGPTGSSGTLDSLHRADFESFGGLLTADALKHRENTAAASLRMVFDMSEVRCYYGLTPTEQSQRPSSAGFGGGKRLQRWSSDDLSLAYDKICPE